MRRIKDAFPKYVDSIFGNQVSIDLSNADRKLQEFAGTTGLDAAKMASCAAAPETEARIKKSLALGQSLEVTETSTVFYQWPQSHGALRTFRMNSSRLSCSLKFPQAAT